jgi:ribosome-binding protein aMBF1 (putative translation factor)
VTAQRVPQSSKRKDRARMSADTSHRDTELALARLGHVVRELREERGLRVEELSVACKIARWRLTRIEAGTLRTVDYGEPRRGFQSERRGVREKGQL